MVHRDTGQESVHLKSVEQTLRDRLAELEQVLHRRQTQVKQVNPLSQGPGLVRGGGGEAPGGGGGGYMSALLLTVHYYTIE